MKPTGSASAQDSDVPNDVPAIGPHNPALGEIYQRLYPEIRRPKPNQEAIAAALQAMQRLTMEADSEHVTEHESLEPTNDPQTTCRVCGHHNRSGNKFCGSCGILLGTEPSEPAKLGSQPGVSTNLDDEPLRQAPPPAPEVAQEVHPSPGSAAGTHPYHHHY